MAKNQGKNGVHKSEILGALPLACTDEAAAVAFLEKIQWGDKPVCPRCQAEKPKQMTDGKGGRNARFLWRCTSKACGKQFTVRVGTVYEDSKIPLRHWCYAFWAACASKKGVSALQVKRQTGLSYESALFMMHRVRFAMADDHSKPAKLSGTIEVDETYVGGKGRHGIGSTTRAQRFAPVLAMLQRGGDVRAFPIGRVTSENLKRAILANVDLSSRLMTDQHSGYPAIGRKMRGGHGSVNHSKHEYVRGIVTTNRVEGFFSLLKRGLMGTFHSVSKKHLHRYVSEFEFRYNARKMDDGQRVALVIRKANGKRLTYKRQLAG